MPILPAALLAPAFPDPARPAACAFGNRAHSISESLSTHPDYGLGDSRSTVTPISMYFSRNFQS